MLRRPTAEQGGLAEARAAAFLESHHLVILERNYRCGFGEIDLVADDGGTLCFVEVRFRHHAEHGTPVETIGLRKRQRIIRAARHYLMARKIDLSQSMRFDVLGVLGQLGDGPSEAQAPLEFTWIRNAFDERGLV